MKGYFDYNGTVPVDAKIKEELGEWLEYGVPGIPGPRGRRTSGLLEMARSVITGTPGLEEYDIAFTSGGTEANRLALEFLYMRTLRAGLTDGNFLRDRVLIFALDHSSILRQAQPLRNMGYDVMLIPATSGGTADLDFIADKANASTCLLSLMLANGDTGVLQPVEAVSEICKSRGIHFHCDASQAPGKTDIRWYGFQPDTISISGHKFGGLAGTGALFFRRLRRPESTFFGDDPVVRPGMPNTPGILSMAHAWKTAQHDISHRLACMGAKRDSFQSGLLQLIPSARILGGRSPRLGNTVAFILPGVTPERLIQFLERQELHLGILHGYQGIHSPSPALLEMGEDSEAGVACRFSIWDNTEEKEIEDLLSSLNSLTESEV
ncbi:MAG: aminotransferase class V-fold PLP-dependent enzyme [Leptospiraceae bacterium]|nr:aminotransferase class V-fold PLP-dependent enzyme [Leptospiraceae bacterium]